MVGYCYTVTSGQNNLPIFAVGCLLLHRCIWPEQFTNIYCWLSTVTPLHLARTIYQYLLLVVYCYTVTSGRNNFPIFTVGWLLLHRYIWPEQCSNIYCWLSTVSPLHLAGTMFQYLLLVGYCYTVTSGRNNVPIFTVGCLLLHRYIWPEQCSNIYCWLATVTPLHLARTIYQYLLLVVYCYTVTSGRNNFPIFTVGWLLLHRYIWPEQCSNIYCWLSTVTPLHLARTIYQYLLLAVYCYTVASGQNNLPIFTVGCLLLHRYIWPEQFTNIYCWLSTVTPLHLAGTISQYLLLAGYCYTVTSGRNNVPIFTVGCLLLHRYIWPEQCPNIYCWLSTVTPLHMAGTMSQYLLLAVYCYTVTSGLNNVPIFTVGCLLFHRYIWPEQCSNIYCWLATVTPLHLAGTMFQYLLLAVYCYTVASGQNNLPIFTVGCLLLHRYIWPEQFPNIYCWLATVTPLHLA